MKQMKKTFPNISFKTAKRYFDISCFLDVDECLFSRQLCATNEHCVNTQGSYTCNYSENFSGTVGFFFLRSA